MHCFGFDATGLQSECGAHLLLHGQVLLLEPLEVLHEAIAAPFLERELHDVLR